MKSLEGFFAKFNSKVAGQVRNLSIIMETIKKHTGIDVEMKNISISGGILRLKISSIEKSQIFIKKLRILDDINKKTQSLVIKDIQ